MYNFQPNLTEQNQSGFELTKNVVLRLNQFDISQSAKLVLIYLTTCYNPDKPIVYPKQETIAETLGISIISVKRAIKEILATGLILKSKSKNQNVYGLQKSIKKIPEKYQKDTSKSINLIPSLYRTNKGTNKQQSVEFFSTKKNTDKTESTDNDFLILKDYALKKGAKNPDAYATALLKNGADEILKEIRSAAARKKELDELSAENKQNMKNWQNNAKSPIDFDENEAFSFFSKMRPEIRARSFFAKKLAEKWGFDLNAPQK